MKHLKSYAASGTNYYTAGGPITYPLSFPITYTDIQIPDIFSDSAFTIPNGDSLSSTTSVTAATELLINISVSGGTSSVLIPAETVITRDDGSLFDTGDLGGSSVDLSTLSGLGDGVVLDGALQWGITNFGLDFDKPITINLFVGNNFDGQTRNILRSTDTSSGWTNDGILDPKTCVVSDGICTFQTTKASYFAITEITPPSGSSGSSSGESSSGSSSCEDTTPTGSPNLFQINATSTKATLYFTPIQPPVSGYFISYGYASGEQDFAVQLNQGYSPGVLNFTINYLQPGKTYYFMIRAENGCTTGGWGNEMKITTGRGNSTIKYYKNFVTRISNLLPKRTTTITQAQVAPQNSPSPSSAPDLNQQQNTPTVTQPVATDAPVDTFTPNTPDTPVSTPAPKSKTCFLFWCW